MCTGIQAPLATRVKRSKGIPEWQPQKINKEADEKPDICKSVPLRDTGALGWHRKSTKTVPAFWGPWKDLQLALWLSSVQSLSRVQLFATPWTAACQASLFIANSRSLPKLISIESVMPSNHLIFCHPLLLLSSIFPSIRIFSNESVLRIRWPKDWSFSFSISPSKEYSGLICFQFDCFDLLAVQGTLKSLIQHHNSKSIDSSALRFPYSSTLTSIQDY